MNDIISKFTDHLKNVLTRALCLVVEQKTNKIEPLHLLWALATQENCVASELLRNAGIDMKNTPIFNDTSITTPLSQEQNFIPPLSEESKRMIERAVAAANTYNHKYIGTEHLLTGLLSVEYAEIEQFFKKQGTDIKKMQEELKIVLQSASAASFSKQTKMLEDTFSELENMHKEIERELDSSAEDASAVEYFTKELTDKKIKETLSHVVGREEEIHRLTNILLRKQKNNPILVGEPGVGKTAIVEGLARQIIDKTAPRPLLKKKIYELDLPALIAGTMYRGEFESRLKQLIEEITEDKNAILFIDEIHMIMGAGATSGSLDAANMLKPALARGDIHCIGATTANEYKKFIEEDGALERRFGMIRINEPSAEETKEILHGIKKHYEEYHGVSYDEIAIKTILEISQEYFPNRHFPDKAIDILDESGAFSNLQKTDSKKIEQIKKKLAAIKEKKQTAAQKEEYNAAVTFKREENTLKKALKQERKKLEKSPITSGDIILAAARMRGASIHHTSHSILKNLQQILKQQVIGQDNVIKKITRSIARAKFGISNPEKPLTSFLFLGPSGVGKTHMGVSLSKALFEEKPNTLLRIDMSEYKEPHTVSKLIGSPAGYVGYKDHAKLTDFVRQNPHCVILFDEVEKAHTNIHALLLQVLDYGKLTDSSGREIDFRQTIIILTSNADQEFTKKTDIGFSNDTNEQDETWLREKLKEQFKPELINRTGHIVLFNTLSDSNIRDILKRELNQLKQRLLKKQLGFEFSQSVLTALLKRLDPKKGARDVQRIIETDVEYKITDLLLNKKILPNNVSAIAKGGEIHVSTK